MRSDLKEVEDKAYRLAEFAKKLRDLDRDWSHLKNQEDFPKVWALEKEHRHPIENLYAGGRQDAINLSCWFCELDDAAKHPTLKSFVDVMLPALERTVDDARTRVKVAKAAHEALENRFWSVVGMTTLTVDQISIAEASIATLNAMKRSKLYREESGEHVVTDQPSVVITNSYNTNSNINSNHSSVTVTQSTTDLFVKIRSAVDSLPAAAQPAISEAVNEMERNVGTSGFISSYKNFMALAADHIGVMTPFLPALAQLLG